MHHAWSHPILCTALSSSLSSLMRSKQPFWHCPGESYDFGCIPAPTVDPPKANVDAGCQGRLDVALVDTRMGFTTAGDEATEFSTNT